MNITVADDQRPIDDVVVVEGDLDAHTAPALRDRLDAVISRAPRRVLLVDLTAVPFLDEGGASLRIVSTQPRVLKVLSLTGLDAVIPTFPTVEAARGA